MLETKRICAVYFSPGGTTRRMVECIAQEMAVRCPGVRYGTFDFTLPVSRREAFEAGEGDMAVVGLPVYAGRLPNLLLDYLGCWQGRGAWVVPVVMYGNRSFGNALVELRDVLAGRGFRPFAAAAFVGQHAFASGLATGRPDAADLALARSFAGKVIARLQAQEGEETPALELPGEGAPGYGGYYQPLGEDGQPVRFLKAKPVTSASCTACGLCAGVCPMGAIDRDRPHEVPGICIKCNACIRACPQGAKQLTDNAYLSHRRFLENHYATPRAVCRLFGVEE